MCNDTLGKSVIYQVKSLKKLSNFFGKGVNLVVNFGKNDNWFWKCKFFGYVSFTGKSENLVETAILKDFFHFCSKWSPFSNMLVFNGDIKFS